MSAVTVSVLTEELHPIYHYAVFLIDTLIVVTCVFRKGIQKLIGGGNTHYTNVIQLLGQSVDFLQLKRAKMFTY